jgi:hypothetical protein
LRRKLTARFHRVWKSRRENPAELFSFSLVLVWLFITATLFHPHFGELKTLFFRLWYCLVVPLTGSHLCGDVDASAGQHLATKQKTAKVIYCF